MNAILKVVAASMSCCALLPAAGQSAGNFVDAANFVIDAGGLNLAIDNAPTSEQKLAQTLTVEVGGELAGVFVPVLCGTGRLIVEIRDVVADQPGPTVLADRSVDPAMFDTGGRFTFVKLGPLTLAPGQRVAIVLSNRKGTCASRQSTVASNYPGGKAFFDARPNPPGWVALGDFPGTPDDLPFQLVLN